MNLTNFKIRKIDFPIGKTDKEINRTPLSQYRKWDTAQGIQYHGGTFYDNSKQSILSQITEMLLIGRKYDKQKMKILEQQSQGITAIEEIAKMAEIKEDVVIQRLKEIEEEGRNHSYYSNTQHIKKIRANSLYGALGNPYFHLYNLKNAINVTLSGQELIKYLSDTFNDFFKNEFYKDRRYFSNTDEINRCTKDVVCLIDTDSVTGDTLIPMLDTLDNTKANELCKIRIDELLFDLRPKGLSLANIDFEKYEVPSHYNWFTWSINTESNELESKPIKHIFRHAVNKEMFEISIGGNSVIVTEDHSIIVRRNSKLISVKPKDIIESDELIYY
jgi:DNA-binding Lrp family transcriptional regulator